MFIHKQIEEMLKPDIIPTGSDIEIIHEYEKIIRQLLDEREEIKQRIEQMSSEVDNFVGDEATGGIIFRAIKTTLTTVLALFKDE